MTRPPMMDKQHLAAFADGELSPEEAAAVVMYLADHPADQAWVDDLMAANAALAQAFSTPLHEPVPDRIMAVLRPQAEVIPFRPARRQGAGRLAGIGLALAATLAAVVVLLQPTPPAALILAGAVPADSPLRDVLNHQAAGSTVPFGSGELTILASMPAADGFCRELELIDRQAGNLQVALACSDASGWVVDAVLAEALVPASDADGFQPAAGGDAALLDRWLDQRAAGLALTPDQEAAAIKAGWAP